MAQRTASFRGGRSNGAARRHKNAAA